jgi:DNA-binding NarL/FixJ family response regulator
MLCASTKPIGKEQALIVQNGFLKSCRVTSVMSHRFNREIDSHVTGKIVADPIRILIAESHEQLREQLTILLDTWEGLRVVGKADNGRRAIELCAQLHPDVVLMNAQMPGTDSFAATRAIRLQWSNIKVVLLTHDTNNINSRMARENGASAFLLKPLSLEQMVEIIRAVYENSYLSEF